ncbi:hypothetical protein TRFO_20858 [Tritrichomonas foetus]|uniref:Uncharacterized protein n=1 Tax=Tritrichomonas foetus TaxID=1144522 RepID=A0A1J4KG95_9EUKA|nr:hypothetical protein TRFO_20858 [Tritrichomonas foetus]|eukprot:OHT10050.1 hypothetical protein TRFO_20858 [Tritrichomonas foetus]
MADEFPFKPYDEQVIIMKQTIDLIPDDEENEDLKKIKEFIEESLKADEPKQEQTPYLNDQKEINQDENPISSHETLAHEIQRLDNQIQRLDARKELKKKEILSVKRKIEEAITQNKKAQTHLLKNLILLRNKIKAQKQECK